MEGTLEDPLVKDPSQDDSAAVVKDIVIPNGVNGSLDDHGEELDDSNGASNKDDADNPDEDKGDDEADGTKDEEEEEEADDDDNCEEVREDGEEAEEEQEEDEEEEEAVAPTTAEEEEVEADEEEEEEEEHDDESAVEETAILETEMCDGVPMDSETAESVECVSDENNVCAVSSDINDDECKDDTNDAMEVDVRSDNSDVECLDVSVVNKNSSSNDANANVNANNTTDEDPKNTSGSSDVQQLNDSVELVEGGTADASEVKICEENGSCGSGPDIEEIINTSTKSNGHNTSQEPSPKDTPKKKSRKQIDLSGITPRRSSRNIKKTSYIEKEVEEEPEDDGSSDIEEIKPEDPLACIADASKDKENSKLKSPMKSSKTTIVVSDTKRLVEIAAGSKLSKGGKKEPTLVIIDTNSILSGRGGIPVGSSGGSGTSGVSGNYGGKISSHQHQLQQHHHHQQQQHQQHHHQQQQQQQQHHHHHNNPVSSSSSYSVMQMGHTQTMFPNMRTTITPVPMSRSSQLTPKTIHVAAQQPAPPPQPQVPQILPTLTDDMFVVEAPSFIVPYVYEKPPLKPLKDFVTKLEKSIAECEEEEKQQQKLIDDEKKRNDTEITDNNAESTNKRDDETTEDVEIDAIATKKSETDNADATVDLTEKTDEKSAIDDKNKQPTYFDLPLGKFFMQIGVNLVQEFVQTDLLRTQKRKQGKHGTASAETQLAINSLIKNLEFSKENNEPFHLEMKKCEFCSFKTESALVMQHHLETPHMKNYVYKCNFCPLEVRSPHDILFHMEAEHNTRGRLERGPAFHQCPNCPFEDNQKGKLTRHILACAKKFRPERNLEPATDWEPPAKIPRLNRPRQMGPVNASALAMAMGAKGTQPLLPKLLPAPVTGRGRGRPPMQPRYSDMKSLRPGSGTTIRQADNVASMMYRPTSSGLLVPTPYQFGSNQIFQVVGGSGTVTSPVTGVSSGSSGSSGRPTPIALVSNIIDSQSRLSASSSQNTTAATKSPAAKLLSQPSISITPLPRTTSQTPLSGSGTSSKPGGKNTFVICEICDGYIKDLEQLRNHMQWIHKVKIHPKMIYNRPPLNCQKCQFRFFTDQGLERHLLGSHGLVTSSMQEAANKGKDAGRCPACGRVYQWKLLNHVARDHGMTLKPAHLSYKCTVCTATFGMYKQFENHVYSAHSVVAKKVMDKKNTPSSPSSRSNDSLLKPLKINDEITIIPQPAKPTTRGSQGRGK